MAVRLDRDARLVSQAGILTQAVVNDDCSAEMGNSLEQCLQCFSCFSFPTVTSVNLGNCQ